MIKIDKMIVILLFWGLIVSCGEKDRDTSNSSNPKQLEFYLTADDNMLFNLKNIVVKEGDFVRIDFENIGNMSIETMGHNFVLLKPGVELASFAAKALASKNNNYIPAEESENIIVYSKLLGPGEKTIIEFTAPSKGTYKFICSFPGHYISMQGNLIVR
jgi:azurin